MIKQIHFQNADLTASATKRIGLIHQQYLRRSIRKADETFRCRQAARYGWKCQRGGETGKSDDLCSLCSNHNLFGPLEHGCR